MNAPGGRGGGAGTCPRRQCDRFHDGPQHPDQLRTVQVRARDEVLAVLENEGIGAGIHYPVPLHRTGAFATDASYPHAEHVAAHTLSLPLHPHLMREQQETVVAALARALSAHPGRPL